MTEQNGFMSFVMRRELSYADACYPTKCPFILAWLAARASCSMGDEAWVALFFLIVFIDDHGLVSFDDALWRLDGSPVLLADGAQKTRAWLHFDVVRFVVARFGHDSGVDKEFGPAPSRVLLGVEIDLITECKSLHEWKRLEYCRQIERAFKARGLPRARFVSLIFKLLVVCEVCPSARQWLHSAFRALRSLERRWFALVPPFLEEELAVLASKLPLMWQVVQLVHGRRLVQVHGGHEPNEGG